MFYSHGHSLLRIPLTQKLKGTWESPPWLESRTELELQVCGEMAASWGLEDRSSMPAQRWKLGVGEKRRTPSFLKQVGYANNWYYKEIKLVDILEKKVGTF